MSDDFEKLEKKVLSKKWGQKKILPEFEVYKEEQEKARKLGWQELGQKKQIKKKSFKITWIAVFSLVVSFALYYSFFLSSPVFNPNSVKSYISGPEKVSSGDLVSYKVYYKNTSNVVLRDVNLEFWWPEGSIFEGTEYFEPVKIQKRVGVLMPNQERTFVFEGRIYGVKETSKKIKTRLSYIPDQLSERYEKNDEFGVFIEAVPIFLNVTLPSQVVSEKESEIKIEYINKSDASFSNMEIRVEYPLGFEFVSSDPNPALQDNIWQLGTIQGEEEGTITIKGIFNGKEDEEKIISVDIGQANPSGEGFLSVANSIVSTKIASSALLVFQTVNGTREASVDLGSTLNYSISYKNTTDTQISNVVIIAKLDDKLVDLKTLNIPWGSFDGRTNSIIWNQTGVPELSILDPKEEGKVSFSVKVRDDFVPTSVSDKNLKIKSFVQIASGSAVDDLAGLPIENSDELEVKINTVLGFNAFGYYNEGPIKNTGPLPPRVGQETTYAVSWQIINTTNDVKDVVVTASVPPNVRWTGVVDPKDAGITFDKERGVITWKPGVVFAGSGYTIPSKRVDFQLSFVPAIVHVGDLFDLLSSSELEGEDVFTKNKIKRVALPIDSSLSGKLKGEKAKVTQ